METLLSNRMSHHAFSKKCYCVSLFAKERTCILHIIANAMYEDVWCQSSHNIIFQKQYIIQAQPLMLRAFACAGSYELSSCCWKNTNCVLCCYLICLVLQCVRHFIPLLNRELLKKVYGIANSSFFYHNLWPFVFYKMSRSCIWLK